MGPFYYSYPTRVYFGEQCVKKSLPDELSKIGQNVMLTMGKGSAKRNGTYDEVIGLLRQANKNVTEFEGIMSNPTYAKVQEGVKLAKENKIDFILALGGGSVMDCSKIIGAQALVDEDLWNMEIVEKKMPTKSIPVGAIVTATGTGSEMNEIGVITHEEKEWKGGMRGLTPVFAFLDPNYTLSVPRRQIFSGAFDTLSHAMESFFGNMDENNVSDDLALGVMKNTVRNMRLLTKNFDDRKARTNLMWDSAVAENGILKLGRSTGFQAHQIEHQLAVYTDCNHGQGLAVIHPVYYRIIAGDAPEKFKRFANEVFGCETIEQGIDALEQLIRECGLPTKLDELASTAPITMEILEKVANSSRIIPTAPGHLNPDKILEILKQCF